MKPPALERTSAAKAGWLVILLTVGWMALVLWPVPAEPPAAKPAAIPLPASSLTRAGLREYTDWAGLPEIFAIWADHAQWQNNRTRFAYWHPVMKTYAYYFEAVKTAHGYRFREITEPHEPDYVWDDSLGDDCPIRFYLNPVRNQKKTGSQPLPAVPGIDSMKPRPAAPEVAIPMTGTKIVPTIPAPQP